MPASPNVLSNVKRVTLMCFFFFLIKNCLTAFVFGMVIISEPSHFFNRICSFCVKKGLSPIWYHRLLVASIDGIFLYSLDSTPR